jgi:succinylarginine dihydrolase
MQQPVIEVNFDGLVGPTHNYAGLSVDNPASASNKGRVSNPRLAALQGLRKMKYLADRGLVQCVLPPHERPALAFLRRIGFRGPDADVLSTTARRAPQLLARACSASAMWAANAATVTPSSDSTDGRVHVTPANLAFWPHRSLETETTGRVLRQVLPENAGFIHHLPLPATPIFHEEGAANQLRVCSTAMGRGIHVFVYGARQTATACQALARLHLLPPESVLIVEQSPRAVAAGVFHNDLISTAHQDVLLLHQDAFSDTEEVVHGLKRLLEGELRVFTISNDELPLRGAIETMFFNSQMVTLPDGGKLLLLPDRCHESAPVAALLARLHESGLPIAVAQGIELSESLGNGGGPACLRLRAVLTDLQLRSVHSGCILSDDLYHRLVTWIETHYREALSQADLADPLLLVESQTALDQLTSTLSLPSVYSFQLA